MAESDTIFDRFSPWQAEPEHDNGVRQRRVQPTQQQRAVRRVSGQRAEHDGAAKYITAAAGSSSRAFSRPPATGRPPFSCGSSAPSTVMMLSYKSPHLEPVTIIHGK